MSRGPLQVSRRLPLLFLAVTLIPALALGWLTFQLVESDRELEAQRPRERVEQAADRIVAASHLRLSELEATLHRLTTSEKESLPPDHTVLVTAEGGSISASPAGGLVFYPILPTSESLPGGVFAEGERLEHQLGSASQAIEVFRTLARSEDPGIRAGALLRLSRNQRKAGQVEAALATYDELATLGNTQVDGFPAALLALGGRCSLLERAGRRTELSRAAIALRTGLISGAWPVLRDTYDFYRDEARRWAGEGDDSGLDADARAFASAFQSTYETWATGGTVPQRRWAIAEGRPVLIASLATEKRLLTLVGGAAFLRQPWTEVSGTQVLLSDGQGRPIFGTSLSVTSPQAVRTADATQWPWTLRISQVSTGEDSARGLTRRTTLVAGLAMVLLLLGGSAYFTLRGITHELAVARLQSDFVSAVSHEFRTPLASIRHLSDLLSKGRVAHEGQRQQCYEFLSRESERLEGLVEGLLDFGRIEEGAYQYRFERIDVANLLRDLVTSFQDKVSPKGYRVELAAGPPGTPVLADREALSRAIWNLFDNAVKYSPVTDTIWVSLALEDGSAVIRVRDRGLGIAPDEQRDIFRKFVRGSNVHGHQIKGTGIGLAMVRHIVEAHRGEVRVDSEPGQGSTFALMLPIEGPT